MSSSAFDVLDVAAVRRWGGEVPAEQVGHLLIGGLGDRGADPAASPVADDAGSRISPGPVRPPSTRRTKSRVQSVLPRGALGQ
jgi:hypothetical protein